MEKHNIRFIPVYYTEEIKDMYKVEEIIKKLLETSMYKEQIKIIQPYALLNSEGEDDGK